MTRFAVTVAFALSLTAADSGWTHYGADAAGTRYSPLKQITPANIQKLKVAWTYHTHALEPQTSLNEKSAFEATPILVNGTLYLSTPFDEVIALDPATGKERWKCDPDIDRSRTYSEVTSRGVSYGHGRIFIGTIDARLIALDAKSGKQDWQVDLTRDVNLRDRGDYQVTSPPAVFENFVIVGSSIGDNRAVNLERGIVRAYDIRTGDLRWTWEPTKWSAANAWSAFAVDTERGFVYVPTGSASPDFYGGMRPGDNKNANSVVALNARDGKLVWAFQVVHHDLWDYDVASQPALFTWRGSKGGNTPAIAITTKIGHLFVLNRVTGEPLFRVEERKVPKSDISGEEASPTQPFPATDPLVPQGLTAADAWGMTDEERNWCREKLASFRTDGMFTPPSVKGTIAFPGNIGGVNWGSAAVDPERGILVTNTNRIATVLRLIPRDQFVSEIQAAKQNRITGEFGRQTGAPYAMYRETLLSPPHRLPCNAPPWGTTTAVDLNTGKKLWETPLGSMVPGEGYGSANLGGPIITAGGVVFTAAARDTSIRALDLSSGKEIWTFELPAGAQATPMTYSMAGKQYVIICAGGHGKFGTKMGDAVVAFALQ